MFSQKKIQEALHKSEARLEEVQKIAHLGYWEYDISGGGIVWTDETYKIFGLEPGGVKPSYEEFLRLVFQEDRGRVEEAVATAIRGKTPYSVEYRIVRPTGDIRTVQSEGYLECDPAGVPLRMAGTVQDITERKQYEESLADRARHASLGADIGSALTLGGTMHEMLQGCAQALVDNLGAALARIWLLHKEEDALALYASAGLYTHLDGPHGKLSYSKYKYKVGIIAREKKPLLTNDTLNDPQISDKEWVRQEGIVSYGGYPLVVEDDLVGVMVAFSRQKMSEATFAALASIADEVAVGIKRKQADMVLRESEERFRGLVEESSAGSYIFQDGRFVYVNPRLAWMYGYSVPEFLAIEDAIGALVHPGDRRTAEDLMRRATSGEGGRSKEEVRITRKDGKVIHVEVYSWGALYKGRPAVIGNAIDITERRMAEDALKESEADLRTLYDSVYDAVFVHDMEGNIIDVNKKMLQLYGVSREEAFAYGTVAAFSSPENPLDRLPEIWRRVNAGESLLFEWKAKRPDDGYEFDVEVFLRRVRLMNRDVILANVRDITERKKAEDERAGLFHMLTHDIKGPLTVISGYAELLSGMLKEQTAIDMVGNIGRASGRISEIVGDMLELTRVESRTELKVEPVSVEDVVRQAVKESEMPAKEKGVHIEIDIDEGLPAIEADGVQLGRAVSNLVCNAVKYNREGGTVKVMARAMHGEPETVRIDVADTGPGIPREDIPHVFDKFYRGRARAKYPGTGLGLSIVKAVADAHGGRVSVKSREGEGSLFSLCLPVLHPGLGEKKKKAEAA